MARTLAALIIALFASYQVSAQLVRTIEGTNNNVTQTEWGSEGDVLINIAPPAFPDGISAMSDFDRPNPRVISNRMFAQSELIPDEESLSDFVWVFGQFIDHEIILVEGDQREPLFIRFPEDDPVFPVEARPIGMFRSAAVAGTGTGPDNPRRYANGVTAYIDASAVYGSDHRRAEWLRTYEGGKLKVSSGNLLPWNTTTGEFNDPRDLDAPFMEDAVQLSQKHFVAGDIRANENPLLIAYHTLFVREHNRLCEEFAIEDPSLSDEELYQKARRWVSGILQNIVYREWLPVMGVKLPEYNGYRPEVNAQISNTFSAAAFRMGHTLINSNLLRLEGNGDDIPSGTIGLRDAFFNPLAISLAGGLDPYFRGMATQVQQKLDCKVVDDVRNFLFGPPEAGGMDLAAININRGRERGLADFNSLRAAIGLPTLDAMDAINSEDEVIDLLLEIYGTVDNVDPWVGMLAEQYMPEAMFGQTIMTIMEEQFKRLRDGDRFYFERDDAFSSQDITVIRSTTMRDVIMRNTGIKIMQDNVFRAMPRQEIPDGPEIPAVDLSVEVYPNPTPDEAVVRLFAQAEYTVDVEIYDNLGRMVSSFDQALAQGNNDITLRLSTLPNSTYYNVVLRKNNLE
ncbi:MAG: peroxidase family protein, partial [Bacteroidota bacterium]